MGPESQWGEVSDAYDVDLLRTGDGRPLPLLRETQPGARGGSWDASLGRPQTSASWLVGAGEDSFEREVTASVPGVIDLWGPWCDPCRTMAPLPSTAWRLA
jgi:thiol-disulfide isomerase/thioredoxin